MNNSCVTPFARPLYVMLKPIDSLCNLRCTYCYYLDKKEYYSDIKNHSMNDSLLEKFIEQSLNSQTMQQVLFTWHGGEPLLRDISFYKKALSLQKKYANGRHVDNSLQTKGTLLTVFFQKVMKEMDLLKKYGVVNRYNVD